MMNSLRAKIIFCSVCSAGLHFLLLEQITIGQTESTRSPAGSSDVQIRYISSYSKPPATQVVSKDILPRDASALPAATPVHSTASDNSGLSETAAPTNESLMVENFYESSDVDEPATPETDWPIVVEGMTRSLTFNVQVSIWISSLGRIEQVEVLQIQPESEKVRMSLQTMVGAMVKPALRAGVSVANKRTLELWLTQ
jgi:hypothetical protein